MVIPGGTSPKACLAVLYLSLNNYLFQQKLILHRQNNFYRVKSGYFRSDEDVKNQAKEKLTVRFPEIPIEKEIKVEKVYTEYRYGQISSLKGGRTVLVATIIFQI